MNIIFLLNEKVVGICETKFLNEEIREIEIKLLEIKER